ncbi:MAG TPA: DUF6390 family protein [Egibacteraceae bacterium]|nr:DUF6390 family protein [Actinomycetota bacterium]HWB73244.1 DUF6390 family protein [Egibacteraceae bacterium]
MDRGPTRAAPRQLPAAGGDGPLLFARYAYPPNELGYCGADDHRALLEYGASGIVDPGLGQLARAFHGAWPYLELIAAATGVGDPLDARVVEAYWVGNRLLERVGRSAFGASLQERFRRQAGRAWQRLAESIPAGGLPHHAFHVFCVYPWVGLLGSEGAGGHPLHVLDRCRIRWGQVLTADRDRVVVRCQPLTWDGRRLALGAPEAESATRAVDGVGFVAHLRPGEWVSLHWDWVCDRLSARQLAALRGYTARVLDLTNRRLAHPGPAAVLS